MLTRTVALVLLTVHCTLETANCVKIIELQVPPLAIVGGEATLSCHYQLGDDNLYSIKWYKDGREFYRYLPSHLIRGMASPYKQFKTPGLTVDVVRSPASMVTLVNLSEQATGAYRCEVSGEAPQFATDTGVGFLNVYLAPDNPPEITGVQSHYKVGERLSARCTIYGTQPEINLEWLLHGEPVAKSYYKGPFQRVSAFKHNQTDTIIQLNLLLHTYKFLNGILTVKCVASLPPVYESETTKIFELLSEHNDIVVDEDANREEIQPTSTNIIPPNRGTTMGYAYTNMLSIFIISKCIEIWFSL